MLFLSVFVYFYILQVHGEMAHMKGEVFMCQVCGKEMIGKNRLRNHMMTHPKGQKFVSCDQCGKVGNSFKMLKLHEYIF